MSGSGWTSPTLAAFTSYLYAEVAIPPAALPPPLTAPAAASLTAGSGGSLPAGPIYVALTYVSGYGETTAGTEASVTVAASGSVGVGPPTAQINAIGYNVYAAGTSGAEVLQNTTPIAIGTAYTINSLTTGTAPAPTVNTSGSPFITYAFNQAMVYVANFPGVGPLYPQAVYNCGTHLVLKITPDVAGSTYFATKRSSAPGGFGLSAISQGIISSASDEGTSNSFVTPEAFRHLTVSDLDFMKTPWGRDYLGYTQAYGPSIWGLS